MDDSGGLFERMNVGLRGSAHVEEEHLILPAQHAEQAAQRHRPAVAGEADVVRFVADRAGAGQRDGTKDLAVSRRIAFEVDDGDEVGRCGAPGPTPRRGGCPRLSARTPM